MSFIKKLRIAAFSLSAVFSTVALFGNTARDNQRPPTLDHSKTEIFDGNIPSSVKQYLQGKWDIATSKLQTTRADSTLHAAYRESLAPLEKWRDQPLIEKLYAVNRFVNKNVDYLGDSAQYGQDDYWASPAETIRRHAGDCEDYAILKYHALRYLGVPENRFCIMAVAADESTKRTANDVDHAILAVDTSANNTWENFLILDNSSRWWNPLNRYADNDYTARYYLTRTECGGLKLPARKP